MRRGWKIALLTVGCAFLVIAAGVGWYVYPLYNDPFNDARFDRTIWLSAYGNSKSNNPRGPMAEDVQQRFLHKGMTRRQVEAVIGIPDGTSWYDRGRGIELYALGYWGPVPIDPQYLEVHYDKHGALIRTKIDEG